MNRRYYSKKHFERLSNGPKDTPETIAERVRYRQITEQANKEMMEKFSPLSPENVIEALTWQENRIKELTLTKE